MRMTSIYIITNVYNSKYCLNKQKIMREGVTLREKRMFGLSPVTSMAMNNGQILSNSLFKSYDLRKDFNSGSLSLRAIQLLLLQNIVDSN